MGGGKGSKGKGKEGKEGREPDEKKIGRSHPVSEAAATEEDIDLAAALGVDQFEEPDVACPWCNVDYTDDSNFCGACGKPRKALTCYNCESHYIKGSSFCRTCGFPRQALPPAKATSKASGSPAQQAKPGSPQDTGTPPNALDWILEDQLVKEAVEKELAEDGLLQGDEMWHMRDMCRTVEVALDPPYEGLVKRFRNRLLDYRSRCDFALSEQRSWKRERRSLQDQCHELRSQLEAERDRALQNTTRHANNSLAIGMMSGGQSRGRASVRLGKGALSMMEESGEQDEGAIDMAAAAILRSRFGSLLIALCKELLPLQTDVESIGSQFGSGCETFFKFYSYLLLLAMLATVCFTPFILNQFVENRASFSGRMCGSYLPCSLFLGSFYKESGTPVEQWITAVELRPASDGNASLSSHADIGREAFDELFASCPMVRFVRDCRVHAMFAGTLDNSTGLSAYDVFTQSWKDMPGIQNKDWIICNRFGDLVQAEAPWPTCSVNSTQAGQGFPGNCQLTPSTERTGRWFAPPGTFEGTLPTFLLRLELWNSTRCFAESQSAIRNMVGGIPVAVDASGKDLWLAFWYFFGNMVSIIIAVLFFLGWWQMTEATYNYEQFTQSLEPQRWSSLVLGLWNFRLVSDSDREVWMDMVANELRTRFNEEKEQEKVKSRTTADRYFLHLKRLIGFLVNLSIIAGLWLAIWILARDREQLVDSIAGSLEQCCNARGVGEWLGSSLAPLLVTGAGAVLPPVFELLTYLEAWPQAVRAQLNIYRFYLGQILTAGLYTAICLELLYDCPLWTGEDLVLAAKVEPCGTYPCKADHAGAEILTLVVTEFVLMMLKPIAKLGWASMWHGGKRLLGKTGNFPWPEFQIQDDAVNVVYFSALLWMCLSTVPYMALIGPVLLYVHFKWLRLSLTFLTRRPFVTETTSLLVTLQRITCINFIGIGLLMMSQLIITVPYEPSCGPVDGFRAAGPMIWSLQFPLENFWLSAYTVTLENRGSIIAVMLSIMTVLWMMHQVKMRTNRSVVEQMSGVANRHVASLERELWRMARRNDLLKRRLEWMEGKESDE